jgi:hypothetical protein
MKMLGGSYGEGSVFYQSYQRQLTIQATSSWKTQEFPISSLTGFEEMGVGTSSALGKAGIGAAAGFLLAGPLAGLAGMAMGASSGSKNSFTFGLGFTNGDSILVNASAKDYAEIKAAISHLNFSKAAPAKQVTAAKSKPTKSKKKNSLKAIAGRIQKTAPNSEAPLAESFRNLKQKADPNSDEEIFFENVNNNVTTLNNYKWRYFDQLLAEDEVIDCVSISMADLAAWPIRFRDTDGVKQSIVSSYEESLELERKELGKFFSFKSKAEIRDDIARFESGIKTTKENMRDCEELASKYERLTPIFKSMAEEFVDKETLLKGMEKYKNLDIVDRKFALKYFGNLQASMSNSKQKENSNNIDLGTQTEAGSMSKADTIEKRLVDLQLLLDKNLISKEEYDQQRGKIILEI